MYSTVEVCADFYMLVFLAAALINWSLISLVDLIAFLLILYNVSQIGKLLSSFLFGFQVIVAYSTGL